MSRKFWADAIPGKLHAKAKKAVRDAGKPACVAENPPQMVDSTKVTGYMPANPKARPKRRVFD
jgi:hypothetical protein